MIAIAQLRTCGILPVVTFYAEDDPVKTARALLAGGLSAIEITMRTKAAIGAMQAITTQVPEMLVGAGTVKSTAELDAALNAGAQFMLSPCLDPFIVAYARSKNVLFIPGVQTASEVQRAVGLGLNAVKFFPAAAAGGRAVLKAWHATFPQVSFMPTGGISMANLSQFLMSPGVFGVGGSWLTPRSALANGDYAMVTALTQKAVAEMLAWRVTDRFFDSDEVCLSTPELTRAKAWLQHVGWQLNETVGRTHDVRAIQPNNQRTLIIRERHE